MSQHPHKLWGGHPQYTDIDMHQIKGVNIVSVYLSIFFIGDLPICLPSKI